MAMESQRAYISDLISNFSSKVNIHGSRSFLQLGYNQCDNPHCSYRNSLQHVKGRYNCLGPAACGPSDGRFKLFRAATSPTASGTAGLAGNPSPLQCAGTYWVTEEQTRYVARLFSVADTKHSKRVKQKQVSRKAAKEAAFDTRKTSQFAAVDARRRAEKLAAEVREDFENEVKLRKAKAQERVKAEEKAQEGEAEPIQQHGSEEQPLKRLKRETRRLPVTIKTGSPTWNANEDLPCTSSAVPLTPHHGSPRSSQPDLPPTLPPRRRLSESAVPRPRPTGVIWDDSIPALDGPSLPSRRTRYPPVSSSEKGRFNISLGTSRPVPKPTVSTKNGITITHFGMLLPAPKRLPGAAHKRIVSSGGQRYPVLGRRLTR